MNHPKPDRLAVDVRIAPVAVAVAARKLPDDGFEDGPQDDGRDRENFLDVEGADEPFFSDRTTDVHKTTHESTDYSAESYY
jgi:hypothetical protein